MCQFSVVRWVCFAVVCVFGARVVAQEEGAQVKLKAERVVVFKDGYALVAKSASGTADGEGRVFTRQVPEAAILGSFWAVGEGQRVLGMRAEWDEKREV